MDRAEAFQAYLNEHARDRAILAKGGEGPLFVNTSSTNISAVTIDHEVLPLARVLQRLLHFAELSLKNADGIVDPRWTHVNEDLVVKEVGWARRSGHDAALVLDRALAAINGGSAGLKGVERLVTRLMFDAAPLADLYRTLLLGRLLPEEVTPGIMLPKPPSGIPFERFESLKCVTEFSKALGQLANGVVQLNRPRPLASARISAVNPARACPNDILTILGTGFGDSRRHDVGVYFNTTLTEVVVNDTGQDPFTRVGVRHERWSDTEIQVYVPAGTTGRVCVDVLEDTLTSPGADADAREGGMRLDGVIGECFPAVAAGLGDFRFGNAGFTASTPRAQCRDANQVWIGQPEIRSFTLNGKSGPSVVVRARDGFRLAWDVLEGNTVEIVRHTMDTSAIQHAPLPPAGAQPLTGTLDLPFVRVRTRWSAIYTIRATNACGTATRNLPVTFSYAIGFVFAGVGTGSIYHVGALQYIETRPTLAPAVCGGTGLGSLAAFAASREPTTSRHLAAFYMAIRGTGLWTRDATIESAFEAYKTGAYTQLLSAVYAFANDVMQRYYAVPEVPTASIKFSTDAEIARKQALKAIGKVLPYGPKLLGELASPSPGDSQLERMDRDSLHKVLKAEKVDSQLSGFGNATFDSVVDLTGSSDVEIAFARSAVSTVSAVVALVPGGKFVSIAIGMVSAIVFSIIEGVTDAAKRDAIRKALAKRGLVDPTPLFTAIDTFIRATTMGSADRALLRVATAVLETGETAYITERGTVDGARDEQLVPGRALSTLLRGAVAMPGLVAPLAVPTRIPTTVEPMPDPVHLVDGATNDPAPVEELIHAGADDVFLFLPSPRTIPQAGPYGVPGFYSIMQRARAMRDASMTQASIDTFEDWRDPNTRVAEVGAYRGSIFVVDATLPLPWIGPYDTHEDILSIWRDYGYLRAFDVFAALARYPDPADTGKRIVYEMVLRENTDALIGERLKMLELEYMASGQRLPGARLVPRRGDRLTGVVTLSNIAELRTRKRAMRDAIVVRLELVKARHTAANWPGRAMPPNFADWYLQFERPLGDHVFGIDPTFNPGVPAGPWSRLGDGGRQQDPQAFQAEEAPPSPIPAMLFQP